VALSLAVAPAVQWRGRYWEIPLNSYPRMEQGGVILSNAKNIQPARLFRAFLLSAEGRAVFKRFGFYLPESH
jgi:molybdate transport system substrate-binding protein